MNEIDIDTGHLQIVRTILHEYIPANVKVYVFGSRAEQKARKYSDLDLALDQAQGKKLPFKLIMNLEQAFEESDLPWKVDILDINAIAPEFKQIIDKNKTELLI